MEDASIIINNNHPSNKNDDNDGWTLVNIPTELSTKAAKSESSSKNIIKIPINIKGNWNTSKQFNDKFHVYALYKKNEKLMNIYDVIITYLNKKHYPINLIFYQNSDKKSFTNYDIWFDEGYDFIKNKSLTQYTKNDIKKNGLNIEIMIQYKYNVLSQDINCDYMLSQNTKNALQCPIYRSMKENNQCTQKYLAHLNEFNHFQNEFKQTEDCKFNDECYAYKRVEAGGNKISDLCHIRLYKHPPRGRSTKLSENIHSLIVNKKNKENCSKYKPTDDDKKQCNYNENDGFLYALIEEVVSNGYTDNLCQTENGYSILEAVDAKMKCKRHKLCGSPLDRGQMLSLILYCGYSCNYDLCKSQRNGNYKKWKWFDCILYKAIFCLSSSECGAFSVYSGLNNVQLDKSQIECGYFSTYVSTSWKKEIAKSFTSGKGMIIEIGESFKNAYRIKCCDVSWISKFKNECEILFARHEGNYSFNNAFKCVVLDNCKGIQTVALIIP